MANALDHLMPPQMKNDGFYRAIVHEEPRRLPRDTQHLPTASFPSKDDITRFHQAVRSKLRNVRLERVLGWLQQDLDYLAEHPDLDVPGIRRIKALAGIAVFDAVLIDGSEFTGRPRWTRSMASGS